MTFKIGDIVTFRVSATDNKPLFEIVDLTEKGVLLAVYRHEHKPENMYDKFVLDYLRVVEPEELI